MRQVNEKTTGEFHDLIPELQQYVGRPARIYFFDEHGTGISLAQGGYFEMSRGAYIIKRDDNSKDSVVAHSQGAEITYSSDNIDGPYISFPAGNAKITIDFL